MEAAGEEEGSLRERERERDLGKEKENYYPWRDLESKRDRMWAPKFSSGKTFFKNIYYLFLFLAALGLHCWA